MKRPSRSDDPLSIRQLEVFVTLVEQRSFTAAARHLGLSQSTVSGHISELEGRLGLRLVERDRSGVEPTAAGRVLLAPCREALRAERSARMAADEINGLLRGMLVVGASTIPAVHLLPAWLGAFSRTHPAIALCMRSGDSRQVIDFVVGGEVDVGIVGLQATDRGLRSTRVGSDELVLVAPAGHRLTQAEALTLADVAAEPMVLREEGSGTRQAAQAALREAGIHTELTVALEVGSTEAVKAAVRAGLGISLVSSLAVRDDVQAGRLAVLPVRGLRIERSFYMVTRDDDRMNPAGRAFRDELLASNAGS